MSESICHILIFGVVLSVDVSGWYIYVRYVEVFGLVEMDLCYLQFGILYVNVGWYMFERICYVVFYQCD